MKGYVTKVSSSETNDQCILMRSFVPLHRLHRPLWNHSACQTSQYDSDTLNSQGTDVNSLIEFGNTNQISSTFDLHALCKTAISWGPWTWLISWTRTINTCKLRSRSDLHNNKQYTECRVFISKQWLILLNTAKASLVDTPKLEAQTASLYRFLCTFIRFEAKIVNTLWAE